MQWSTVKYAVFIFHHKKIIELLHRMQIIDNESNTNVYNSVFDKIEGAYKIFFSIYRGQSSTRKYEPPNKIQKLIVAIEFPSFLLVAIVKVWGLTIIYLIRIFLGRSDIEHLAYSVDLSYVHQFLLFGIVKNGTYRCGTDPTSPIFKRKPKNFLKNEPNILSYLQNTE